MRAKRKENHCLRSLQSPDQSTAVGGKPTPAGGWPATHCAGGGGGGLAQSLAIWQPAASIAFSPFPKVSTRPFVAEAYLGHEEGHEDPRSRCVGPPFLLLHGGGWWHQHTVQGGGGGEGGSGSQRKRATTRDSQTAPLIPTDVIACSASRNPRLDSNTWERGNLRIGGGVWQARGARVRSVCTPSDEPYSCWDSCARVLPHLRCTPFPGPFNQAGTNVATASVQWEGSHVFRRDGCLNPLPPPPPQHPPGARRLRPWPLPNGAARPSPPHDHTPSQGPEACPRGSARACGCSAAHARR